MTVNLSQRRAGRAGAARSPVPGWLRRGGRRLVQGPISLPCRALLGHKVAGKLCPDPEDGQGQGQRQGQPFLGFPSLPWAVLPSPSSTSRAPRGGTGPSLAGVWTSGGRPRAGGVRPGAPLWSRARSPRRRQVRANVRSERAGLISAQTGGGRRPSSADEWEKATRKYIWPPERKTSCCLRQRGGLVLSEISPTQKDKCCRTSLPCGTLGRARLTDTDGKRAGAGGGKRGEAGNGHNLAAVRRVRPEALTGTRGLSSMTLYHRKPLGDRKCSHQK